MGRVWAVGASVVWRSWAWVLELVVWEGVYGRPVLASAVVEMMSE